MKEFEIREATTDGGTTVYDVYEQMNGDSDFCYTFDTREDAKAYILRQNGAYETVEEILNRAYKNICDELEAVGVKYDAGSDDVIFYDDTNKRETFAINIFQHKCEEYEGE